MSAEPEKGTCRVCGRPAWVDHAGIIADHDRVSGHPSQGLCYGGGQPTADPEPKEQT